MGASPVTGMFEILEDLADGQHRFVRIAPVNPEGLAEALTPHIQDAYLDLEHAEERFRAAIADLGLFNGDALNITDSTIQQALEEQLDAVLPAEWKAASVGGRQRPKHTSVQRSELTEILAKMALQDFFNTTIPATRTRHKELPDQQSRGVDVLGLENISLPTSFALVLAEVKGSCEAKSPPGVVKGMKDTLRDLAGDRRRIIQELIWLRDNCDDEHTCVCDKILVSYQLKLVDPKVVMAPVLVRTADTASASDAGEFKTKASEFANDIRFLTIILNEKDLFDFAVKVYRMARELTLE